MTVNDVFKWVDQIAPFETQDSFDNSGLLAGDPHAEVHSVYFTLDVTLQAITEAKRSGASLMISHHPLMFRPIQQIRCDQSEGAILAALFDAGISLIAAHTNLDICAGGVADSLAETLALQEVHPSDENPYLRTGKLAVPGTAQSLLSLINQRLSASTRMYGNPETVIRTVAVVPGAGGDVYPHVQADAFVTGEIKHHELLNATSKGLVIFDAGHYPTEYPGIGALYQRFLAAASQYGWIVEAKLNSQLPYLCTQHI